jgi:hypothetical protein
MACSLTCLCRYTRFGNSITQVQVQVQVQVQAVAPSPLSSFWTHQNDHTVVEHGGGVSVPGLPDVWMTPGHCFWLIGYLDHSTSFEGRDS